MAATANNREGEGWQFTGLLAKMALCNLERHTTVLNFGLHILKLYTQCKVLQPRHPLTDTLIVDNFLRGLGGRYAAFKAETHAELARTPAGSQEPFEQFETALTAALRQEKAFRKEDKRRMRADTARRVSPQPETARRVSPQLRPRSSPDQDSATSESEEDLSHTEESASSSESEDSSSDEEEEAQDQRTGTGGSTQRNPSPAPAIPAARVTRPIAVPERGPIPRLPLPGFTPFPSLRPLPRLTERLPSMTPTATPAISFAALDAVQRASSQAIHAEEAHLARVDAAERAARRSGSGGGTQTALDEIRRETPRAVDEVPTRQESFSADMAPSTRSAVGRTQGGTGGASARTTAQSAESVQSVRERDRDARQAVRVTRREQREAKDAAAPEGDARAERRRRLYQQMDEMDVDVDLDEEPARRARKRPRRSLGQRNDQPPRIKQESPAAFGANNMQVQIKQESPSPPPTQQVEHQGIAQPAVKIEQIEDGSSSGSPMHGLESRGTFAPVIPTEQQHSRRDFRSRPGTQMSPRDGGEVEPQTEEESSSRAQMQPPHNQVTFQHQEQTEQRGSQYGFQPRPVPRPAPRDVGEVELVFTGKRAMSKQNKMIRYGPVVELHVASMTRAVGNDEWLAAAKLVMPNQDVKCSTDEFVRKWRHTAKLEYAQKRRYIAQGILKPKESVTAQPPPQIDETEESRIESRRKRLAMLTPLIALHETSTRRVVNDEEWLRLRRQSYPDGQMGQWAQNTQADCCTHAHRCGKCTQGETGHGLGGCSAKMNGKYTTREGCSIDYACDMSSGHEVCSTSDLTLGWSNGTRNSLLSTVSSRSKDV